MHICDILFKKPSDQVERFACADDGAEAVEPWGQAEEIHELKEKLTVTKESVSNQNVMATYYSILGNGRESQDMFSIEPGSSPYLWV